MTNVTKTSALEALPESVRGPLLVLNEGLERAGGSNLSALVVYGSPKVAAEIRQSGSR